MSYANFYELRSEVFNHYQQGDYARAIEIINQHLDQFPSQVYQTYNWRICMAALMEKPTTAIEYFEEALDKGLWWTEESLREDPDLASLQGDAQFEHLVNLSSGRQALAQSMAKPELLTLVPENPSGQAYPLLFAIHGRSNNHHEFARYWQELVDQGWLVALPQSSQILGTGAYGWDDDELAMQEILAHYADLCRQYPIDPERVIVAGFSQGGGLSIRLALSEEFSARGFIPVAPYLSDISLLEGLPKRDQARTPLGYLVLGGQDQGQELFQNIQSWLLSHEITYQVEEHPELAHEFPPTFSQSLKKALAFILAS